MLKFQLPSGVKFLGHMLVCDKYKLIVHVMPKCACTYIIRWVSQLEGYFEEHGHSLTGNTCAKYGTVHMCSWNNPANKLWDSRGNLTPEGKIKIDTYHKVYIMRNPFDRLVSFYLANHRRGTFKDMIIDKLIKKTNKSDLDHIVPLMQYRCLEMEYDTYIRFDHMEEDFNALREKLGIIEPFTGLGINNRTSYMEESTTKEAFGENNLKSHSIDSNVTYCGNVDYDKLTKPFPRWPNFYDGDMEGSVTRQIVGKMFKEDLKFFTSKK